MLIQNLGKYSETRLSVLEDKRLLGTSCLDPHVIFGDDTFPLKTYLMRLYPGSQSKGSSEKSDLNYLISRAKKVLENSFGILRR